MRAFISFEFNVYILEKNISSKFSTIMNRDLYTDPIENTKIYDGVVINQVICCGHSLIHTNNCNSTSHMHISAIMSGQM